MDDPIVTMRMQYIEDLEDILQCPVCWEIPDASKAIITCAFGHHMCSNCKTTKNINACPTCQSDFNGSRNFLAESLSSKFNDIKESLIDPNHYTNRKIIKKSVLCQTIIEKSSIETQTFTNNTSINTQTEKLKENNEVENLIEVEALINGLYENSWIFPYNKMKNYKYNINILNVGYFLFNIFIDEKGDLEVNINSFRTNTKQKIYYVIILSDELNGLVSRVFKGIVSSVDFMQTKCFNRNVIKSKSFSKFRLEEINLFKCSLNLFLPDNE